MICELRLNDGGTIQLAGTALSNKWFVADCPLLDQELLVDEVRFICEELPAIIRFVVDKVSLFAGEAGEWSLEVDEDDYGNPVYTLRYLKTHAYGERVRGILEWEWDHEREDLVIN